MYDRDGANKSIVHCAKFGDAVENTIARMTTDKVVSVFFYMLTQVITRSQMETGWSAAM